MTSIKKTRDMVSNARARFTLDSCHRVFFLSTQFVPLLMTNLPASFPRVWATLLFPPGLVPCVNDLSVSAGKVFTALQSEVVRGALRSTTNQTVAASVYRLIGELSIQNGSSFPDANFTVLMDELLDIVASQAEKVAAGKVESARTEGAILGLAGVLPLVDESTSKAASEKVLLPSLAKLLSSQPFTRYNLPRAILRLLADDMPVVCDAMMKLTLAGDLAKESLNKDEERKQADLTSSKTRMSDGRVMAAFVIDSCDHPNRELRKQVLHRKGRERTYGLEKFWSRTNRLSPTPFYLARLVLWP